MEQGNGISSTAAELSSALSRRSFVSDSDYATNQAKINYLQGVLNNWVATNERGHDMFVQWQEEMTRLVQAGEQARLSLLQVQNAARNPHHMVQSSRSFPLPAPTFPISESEDIIQNTAKIEEVNQSPLGRTTSRQPEQSLAQYIPTFHAPQEIRLSQVQQAGSRQGKQSSHPNLQPGAVEDGSIVRHGRLYYPRQYPDPDPRYSEHQKSKQSHPPQQGFQHQQQSFTQQYPSESNSSVFYRRDYSQPYSFQPVFSQANQLPARQVVPGTTTSSLSGALEPSRVSGINVDKVDRGAPLEQNPVKENFEAQPTPVPEGRASPPPTSKQSSGVGRGTLAVVPLPETATVPHSRGGQEQTSMTSNTPFHQPPGSSTVTRKEGMSSLAATASSSTAPSSSRANGLTLQSSQSVPSSSTDRVASGEKLARKVAEVANVLKSAPNGYSMVVPGTNIALFKDQGGNIRYLLASDQPSNTSTTVLAESSQSHQLKHRKPTKPSDTPETPEKRSHSRSELNNNISQASQSNLPPKNPMILSTKQPSVPRTPLQVNKTRLARDILRSLGVSPTKGKEKRAIDEPQSPNPKRRQLEKPASSTDQPDVVAEVDFAPPFTSASAGPTEMHRSTELSLETPTESEKPRQPQEHITESSQGSQPTPSIPVAEEPPSTLLEPPHQVDLNPPTALSDTVILISDGPPNPKPLATLRDVTPPSPPHLIQIPSLDTEVDIQPPDTSTEVLEINDDSGESKIPNTTGPSEHDHPTPISDSWAILPNDLRPKTNTAKEPLFLPSPAPSPSRLSIVEDEPIEVDASEEGITGNGRTSLPSEKKGQKPYVLIPPRPTWSRTAFPRQQQKPKYAVDGVKQEAEGTWASDPAEAAALEQSSLRLLERSCKWKGCNDTILNSNENLYKHLVQHVTGKKVWDGNCLWEKCSKRFSDTSQMIIHLESHARTPIPCAFQGCNDTFRRPRELVRHNSSQHQQEDELKMSANPFKPRVPPQLGDVPETLPAHRIEPRFVRKAVMLEDGHQQLGEWVLRNIMGPVSFGTKKLGDTGLPAGCEYDFLARLTGPSKMAQLDDLDSVRVSELLHKGMVFWGPEDTTSVNELELADVSKPIPDSEPDLAREVDGNKDVSVTSEEISVEAILGLAEERS